MTRATCFALSIACDVPMFRITRNAATPTSASATSPARANFVTAAAVEGASPPAPEPSRV